MPPFTGECQQVFMTAFFTSNPGKPQMEIAAIQVLIDYSDDICPPETVPGSIHIIPCPFQFFKMIFNTFVICACLGVARLVNIKIMCC